VFIHLKKNSFNLSFILILLVFLIPVLSLSATRFENELQLTSTSDINVTNFSKFEKFDEEELIHSSKNDTHIEFLFNTSSPEHPLLERYEYSLPINCTDFSTRIKLHYSMSSISEGMIAYFGTDGEDHPIVTTGMQDAWIASQGLFYVKGFPFGITQENKSNPNSAGLAGIVTFQISRTNNVVIGKILNEDATTILYSYQYTEGFDTRIFRIVVAFRTNFDATEMRATFFSLEGSFTPGTYPTVLFGFPVNSLMILTSIIFIMIFLRSKKKNK